MSRQIEWDGRTWPSIAAAARYEGVDPQTIRYWLGLKASRPPSTSVTIRGVRYASIAEAARDVGVAYSVVFVASRRNTLDNVGLRKLRRMGNASGGC